MLWEGDRRKLENVFVAPKFGLRNRKCENFLKGTFASCSLLLLYIFSLGVSVHGKRAAGRVRSLEFLSQLCLYQWCDLSH